LEGVLSLLLPSYRPSAVVVCAGVDGLASDRMSPFNLTTRTYARAVHILKKRLGHFASNRSSSSSSNVAAAAQAPKEECTDINGSAAASNGDGEHADAEAHALSNNGNTAVASSPTDGDAAASSSASNAPSSPASSSSSYPSAPIPLLLLGGGGYNPTDSARAFLHMTAVASNHMLPATLPDHERFLPSYLPNLSVHSVAKNPAARPNDNSREDLLEIMARVRNNCRMREEQDRQEDGLF
jgi:hypothetical protein